MNQGILPLLAHIMQVDHVGPPECSYPFPRYPEAAAAAASGVETQHRPHRLDSCKLHIRLFDRIRPELLPRSRP